MATESRSTEPGGLFILSPHRVAISDCYISGSKDSVVISLKSHAETEVFISREVLKKLVEDPNVVIINCAFDEWVWDYLFLGREIPQCVGNNLVRRKSGKADDWAAAPPRKPPVL